MKRRTRTIERTLLVPHTIDGRTEMVLDKQQIEVPEPPRDWDHLVLNAVTGAVLIVTVACIAWSTVSIGSLLERVAPHPAAAYAAALVFDAGWLVCLALEWLSRYDAARAAGPKKWGRIALVVAMVAIAAHGFLDDQKAIGIIAALVSGIAKGLWSLTLAQYAKPLDNLTQQWVDQQRARAGAELAMVAVQRQLQRSRGAVAAARRAELVAGDPDPDPDGGSRIRTSPDADPDTGSASPDPVPVPAAAAPSGPMTMRDAVRTALDSGIDDPDAVLRYVRTVADANAKADTVSRYLRTLRRSA
ncbi:protein transporter Sec31 [Streptomyces albidoflavus]